MSGHDYIIERGATSVIMHVFLHDSAGAGLTGLTSSTSGLVIAAVRPGEAAATVYTVAASNIETITTVGTYQSPTAGKIRFKEIDATNLPGWYEVHPADALLNTTGTRRGLVLTFKGAASLVQANLQVQLIGNTLQASGIVVGTNNDKADYFLADGAVAAAKIASGAFTAAKFGAGFITSSSFASAAIDAAAIAPDAIGASEFSQAAADKVWSSTTRQLTGTQTFNLTGSITGNLSGSVGSVSGAVGSITGVTFPSGFSGLTIAAIADGVWDEPRSGHTTSGTFGQGVASVQGAVTGAVASVTAGVTLAAGAVDAVWDEVIESTFTARQLARGWSAVLLGERAGAGTSSVVYTGVDGSTARVTLAVAADGDSTAPPTLALT